MKPKISILTPSFNHESYVGFFIESVLNQSFADFELIIVDDCSSDNNVNEIEKFKDSRIKLIKHAYNQGINATLNTAFENSSGEYLIFCASDDCLESNALEEIYKALCENPQAKAVYPALTKIDMNGKKDSEKFMEIKQTSREEYINRFFMDNNYFTSPGMAMRRIDFMQILYPLDMAMCNQQDTQMHIKILLRGDVKILDKALVLYRFDSSANNISARTFITTKREQAEIERLMDSFLEMRDIELLKKVFKKEIADLGITPKEGQTEYFLGRMALLSTIKERQIWGYHKIMESYSTKEKAESLKENYNFDFKQYLSFAGYIDDTIGNKYRKYKKLFKILIYINIALCFIIIGLIVMGGH